MQGCRNQPRRLACWALCGMWLAASTLLAEDASQAPSSQAQGLAEKLKAAKSKAANQRHVLQYQFEPGQRVRTKVVHLVTIETKIQGVTQTARTRSVSTKAWEISDVDSQGRITLVHRVEDVDMWQKVSERQEVRYNSKTDEKPPPGYEHVAESVGTPLATIILAPSGRVVKRENARPQFNPGIGGLAVPLPEQAVKPGDQWALPDELQIRLPEGIVKRIQTRQLYRLEKVETGVATISMQTQVLTPVNDPKIQSQLVQRLSNGTIKFDVDAGRVLSKQMDLDETVIGFNGPDSIMQYMARLTEELLKE